MRFRHVVSLVVLGAVVLAGCSPSGGGPATATSPGTKGAPNASAAVTPTAGTLTKVTLPVGYIADVQFAPLYVAVEKGFYREQGLDVDFDYRFEPDFVKLVGTNAIPFAIASGEQVVLARSQDLPVVYVMQWYCRFPIAVLSKKSAGIATPQDLKGKKVGLPILGGASYVGWRGLLWKSGIAPTDVKEDNLNGFVQLQALQGGKEDAVVVYANNEPVQMRLAGEEANVIYVADYVNLVANGLISNETLIASNPALVRAMTAATLKGIQYTLVHPDEAFTIAQKFVPDLSKDEASAERGKAVLAESMKLWQCSPPGASDPAAWTTTQEVLVQMGQVKQPGDVTRMFTNDFVGGGATK